MLKNPRHGLLSWRVNSTSNHVQYSENWPSIINTVRNNKRLMCAK
jgi:hypothetical protein